MWIYRRMKYHWLLRLNRGSEMQMTSHFRRLIKRLPIPHSQIDVTPPRQRQIMRREIPAICHIFNTLLVSEIIAQLLILYNFSFPNGLDESSWCRCNHHDNSFTHRMSSWLRWILLWQRPGTLLSTWFTGMISWSWGNQTEKASMEQDIESGQRGDIRSRT